MRTLYFCCLFPPPLSSSPLSSRSSSSSSQESARRILDLQGSFGQVRSSSLAEASGSPEIKPTFETAGIQLGHLKIKYADGAFWILYYCRELASLNIIPSESHMLNGFLPRSTTLHCRRFPLQKKFLLSWSRAHANHFAAIYVTEQALGCSSSSCWVPLPAGRRLITALFMSARLDLTWTHDEAFFSVIILFSFIFESLAQLQQLISTFDNFYIKAVVWWCDHQITSWVQYSEGISKLVSASWAQLVTSPEFTSSKYIENCSS